MDTGRFKPAHLVPVGDHARTGRGEIVVPYEATTVKQSPKAPKDHVMTVDLRDEVSEHYGVEI